MKAKKRILAMFVCASALALCLGIVGCSSGDAGPDGPAANEVPETTEINLEEAIANAKPEDPYVADEVCLSCHGGTYEALAKLTDAYGDSNPHAGTHGVGGMSCNQCHSDGMTPPTDEQNMCLDCHAWPRADESYIEYMDL